MTNQPDQSTELKRIRIACAEAMGWKIDPELEDGALMGHHPVPDSDFMGWDMVPDFDSDPAAALTLVDKLANDGWFPLIRKHLNISGQPWSCELSKFGEQPSFATAPTFAEAIARAFLKVKGVTI